MKRFQTIIMTTAILLLVTAVVFLFLGPDYFAKKASKGQSILSQNTHHKNMTNTPTEKTPQKRALTPQAIAKAKNVPVSLSDPKGDYTLVAVVEGSAANQRLNQSLRIVSVQRQRLLALSQQFDKTSVNAVEQRELIARRINESRKTLETNLQFMAENYAYSLNNNYMLVPHEAGLLEVIEEDGKTRHELRHEFNDTQSYQGFQKRREGYLELKIAHAKVARKKASMEGNGGEEGQPADETLEIEPTPEMKERRKQMIETYQYDPEKNYIIDFKKTALYIRPAK